MGTITLNVEWLQRVAFAWTGKEVRITLDAEDWTLGQAGKNRVGVSIIDLSPRLLTTDRDFLPFVFAHEVAHIALDNTAAGIPVNYDRAAAMAYIATQGAAYWAMESDADLWALEHLVPLEEALRRQGKTFLDMALRYHP